MASPSWLVGSTTSSFCLALWPVPFVNRALETRRYRNRPPSSSTKLVRQTSAASRPSPVQQTHLVEQSLSYDLSCSHFQSCSGCTHEFDLHRPDIMDDVYAYFKNHGVTGVTFNAGRLWGWRFRAKLAVRGSSQNPQIGLYEKGSHNVVDIPKCKAHHPNINEAVKLLKQGITELDVAPYNDENGTGKLRYVQMAVSTYNTSLPEEKRYRYGTVQVTLVWNSASKSLVDVEKLNEIARFLWKGGGRESDLNIIHSVRANFQTSATNIIFGNNWVHLIGHRDFWQHVGGIDFLLPPSSFWQANIEVYDSLLQRIHKNVPSGASVSDLYAGSGVIGLSVACARKCKSVRCVEVKKESKISFEKMAQRLPKILNSNITWHCGNVSKKPVFWFVGSDVIIVNPPKEGLDAPILHALQNMSSVQEQLKTSKGSSLIAKDEKRPWILRAQKPLASVGTKNVECRNLLLPHTLIYVSCGWESFKKDCDLLMASDEWELRNAHGFNSFPGTQRIEVMATFRRSRES